RRIGEFLEDLDRIPVPDEEISRLQERLIAEITALWQTDEVRSRRPMVNDEIKMGLDYYDVSIFATLPKLYEEVSAALASEYGMEIDISELPLLLGFGSWIGGDRDGNPFVTPDVTREAIRAARTRLLEYYRVQGQRIIDLLTPSAQQLPISEELSRRLHEYLSEVRTGTQQLFGARFEFELYRRFMVCVHARLLRTAGEAASDTDSLEAALS